MAGSIPRRAGGSASAPWDEDQWARLHERSSRLVLAAFSDEARWTTIVSYARAVLRTYSTSFFLVTRFLPRHKREKVEVIYAAVRYPDEIVDSFPLTAGDKLTRLQAWHDRYELGLEIPTMAEAVSSGVPALLAGFVSVVRQHEIPHEHYRAFLEAMRRDAAPTSFETLDDLIESYIYGSAVVVGLFLTQVYGPNRAGDLPRARQSARDLAIALQLTNFLRDVAEDQRRGRVYLPLACLRREGIDQLDTNDAAQHAGIGRVLAQLSREAEARYASAARDLDAFSPDCQPAIGACIEVYRRLNLRIAANSRGILHREQVPFIEKYRALPASKYWRIPLGYLASARVPSW